MLQEIIRGEFGQHYTFLSADAYSAKLELDSKTFWDIEYTRQFVSSLHTTPNYFAKLLSQLGQSCGQSIEERVDAISHALLNRQLHVYPVKPLQIGEADLASRTLELDNFYYQIRHPSVVLHNESQCKNFTSKPEALAFIQQFELDNEAMSQLIKEADWQVNLAALDLIKKSEKLAELVLANKLVITRHTSSPLELEQQFKTTVSKY